jgi:hypothetical protein
METAFGPVVVDVAIKVLLDYADAMHIPAVKNETPYLRACRALHCANKMRRVANILGKDKDGFYTECIEAIKRELPNLRR